MTWSLPLSGWIASSLGRRLGCNLFLSSVLGLFAILLLLGAVIDQRFTWLEKQELNGHIERTGAMLHRFEQTALTRSLDWAVWDDSFNYVEAPNQTYETANLNLPSMRNIEISAVAIVRFDGSFSKSIYFDLAKGTTDKAAAVAFELQAKKAAFAQIMRRSKTHSGFMRVGDRILVVAGAQIFKSDGSGTPPGYLVMGRELRDSDVQQALQLPARIVVGSDAPSKVDYSPDRVAISTQIVGTDGKPAALMRYSVPRSLHREGVDLLWLTIGGVAMLLSLTILFLNWRLRAVFIRPMQAFQSHVSRISATGELARFGDGARRDELGALYREFNRMADELDTLRAKVEAQSFAIGKRDSAIDVMHNVRNAMSPVQAILGKLEQRLVFGAEANVARALEEIEGNVVSPQRRNDLLGFLRAATAKVSSDFSQYRSDVREALRSLGRADETIVAMRSADRPSGAAADCELSAVIGASCSIVRHNNTAAIDVDFVAEERFRVAMPRVLLAQIVDNLLTNAAEAIIATSRGHGSISISARLDESRGVARVLVRVRDDGDGFSPESASHLFERGASSRDKESGGIGLHWCANTLNAHGGTIEIISEGVGLGATANMWLPLAENSGAAGGCGVAEAA